MNLIGWWKLEDRLSEDGPDFTETGTPSYSAGKFNNGVSGLTNLIYLTSTNAMTNSNRGTIEFWWKPGYNSASTTNAAMFHHVTSWEFSMWWVGAQQLFDIYFYNGGYKTRYAFAPSFSSGQFYHIAISWDASAGAGLKIKMYLDGTPVTVDSILLDSTWSAPTLDLKISGVYDGNVNAQIDNIKLWDDVKTDFSDRFWEDGNPPAVATQLRRRRIIS
jgi:hypothetical protein